MLKFNIDIKKHTVFEIRDYIFHFQKLLWFCLCIMPIKGITQATSDSLKHIVPDTTRYSHAFLMGAYLTTSGPGSLLYGTLVYGGGLHQILLIRKNNKPHFLADVKLAYLIRNNVFSNAWNDLGVKTYQSYGYFWQASAGWNINDSDKDHLMYIGPFVMGKIYDTHINRNQYSMGCALADDLYLQVGKIPLICIFKMYIPLLDYTESTEYPFFFPDICSIGNML
jgi:hypothetical protein